MATGMETQEPHMGMLKGVLKCMLRWTLGSPASNINEPSLHVASEAHEEPQTYECASYSCM